MKCYTAVLCLWILGLVACSSPSKSYYVLTSDGPAPSRSGMGIGIGPVSLAEYVDRPNLVLAESPHQLSVAEDHRWAGDLSDAIARVVAVNVGRRSSTGNVMTYPWRSDDLLRYQVTLDIRQLHGGADGFAVLEAGWRVYLLPERSLVKSGSFTDREALAADGYAPLVAAQSILLSRLSAEIAQALR